MMKLFLACVVLSVSCSSSEDPVNSSDAGLIDGASAVDAEVPALVEINNFTARLVRRDFQCQPIGVSQDIACATYRFTFSLENNYSATIESVDNLRWTIGTTSASSTQFSCDQSPWNVFQGTSSSVIEIEVDFAAGINHEYPCGNGMDGATVPNLPPASYSGEATLQLDVTMEDALFLQVEASSQLVDAS